MAEMAWIGRLHEIAALEAWAEGPAPVLGWVRGPSGSGRTALLRRAAHDRRLVWWTGLPVPPSVQYRALAGALSDAMDPSPAGEESSELDPWLHLARTLTAELDRRREPLLLVLDDADLLPRPGVDALLGDLWTTARARGLPLRILVSTLPPAGEDDAPFGPTEPELTLDLPDLTFREVSSVLPEAWSPAERLTAWAAFGGRPARLRHLDPGVRPPTGIARAILDPAGPLHREGLATLERIVQKPERYAGILGALARGAEDWPGIRERVPELEDGRRLAPYVAALEGHGLVRRERSLDARPSSRNRRYRLPDLFMGFWFGSVLPHLSILAHRAPVDVWRDRIRPALDLHLGRAFRRACGEALLDPPRALFPGPAREVGGLWGEGYDLPVAATLRTGAVILGDCVWGREATLTDATALREAQRATRYGFGREARMRVVFAGGEVSPGLLRRSAREHLLEVVRLRDLSGRQL